MDKNLSKKYQKILLNEELDALKNDVINWEKFWDIYFLASQNCFNILIESFSLKEKTSTSDIYEVEDGNKNVFTIFVNFLSPKDIENRLIGSFISAPEKDKEIYKKLLEKIKSEKAILNLNFYDSHQRIVQTNEVGNRAFTVFMGIKNSVNKSLFDRNVFPNILFFLVKKEDVKKMNFFLKTYQRILGNLQNYIVDSSDIEYNIIYCFD